jgi:hypothetical protein
MTRPQLSLECNRRGRTGRKECEVIRLNYIRSEERGPANDVCSKLAHLTGSRVAHEGGERVFVEDVYEPIDCTEIIEAHASDALPRFL